MTPLDFGCEMLVNPRLADGAPMYTLHKDFITKYNEKWPSASIIVVQCHLSWLFIGIREKVTKSET